MAHELLALPGVRHRHRHLIFSARCNYCKFLSKYIQRTAPDFDTEQVAGVPPHRVPSFWGHCCEYDSQQELTFLEVSAYILTRFYLENQNWLNYTDYSMNYIL